MILKDLSKYIVFDVFPLLFEPKQKIILTHLMHLEKHSLPEKLPMIFTTEKLANQLKRYCEDKNRKFVNKSNLVIVKPYEYIDIVLERRLTLQILFCTSNDEESNNVLVLIRQNGKLNYVYGGNFTDVRTALLNDTFASWIALGVDKLYVNLKRIEESHSFNDFDQVQKVFPTIEYIAKYHGDSKLHIYLPLFGLEQFIFKLAQHMPKRIKFSNLEKFYMNLCVNDPTVKMLFLNDNETHERIVLLPGESFAYQAMDHYKITKIVTINIHDDYAKCDNNEIHNSNGYYELFYSPEPSPFQLKLLCMLVKPNRIFGIVDTFNNKSIVPKYLYELCVGAKERISKRQERKLSDPFGLTGSNNKQQPTTIIGGALPNEEAKKSGPYLSDSESTDDENI